MKFGTWAVRVFHPAAHIILNESWKYTCFAKAAARPDGWPPLLLFSIIIGIGAASEN